MWVLAAKILGSTDKATNSSSGSSLPDTVKLTASNTALYIPKSTLELVLVLDTGSMGEAASTDASQGTKIEGLRTAWKNLVTSLFSQSGNNSYVGLVYRSRPSSI